ncbi:hypothetical protein [Hymenobacter cellulosivorans]|uniref:SCP2 domain-containing protein n=1 Tax=Hymenobacter cellulosivorans TaxID=2932249 RepID=A0ABY4FEC1_9BACT|nr:hypothetical protein [Hymenobacter cellulosivorans]UOQ54949.1 hypothetical protein MUN80_09370 [Hymenobacter cellulosivorans]
MTQKEFTDYVIPRLLDSFPQLISIGISTSEIVLSTQSKQGRLVLQITTQAKELTIGFATTAGPFGWHVHMSQLGAITLDKKTQAATQLLRGIFTDNELIVYSTTLGYFLTDDLANVYQYQQPDESIDAFYWSEL